MSAMGLIQRVVCAISGGVDSAVAALLLKRQGFQVTGVFMKNWDLANETGHCTADYDCDDAQYVCKHLDIPFHEVNFVKEYWTEVFMQMIEGYERGTTPNPDVLCNKFVKFGHFHKRVISQFNADALATGHYARNSLGQFLEHADSCDTAKLLKSVDQVKDQTLFLCQMPQVALKRTMFPLGDLTKDVVKQIAKNAGLEKIARKKESMGICFIGCRHFPDFIEDYIAPKPGNFIDIETDRIVGCHKGKHYWTLGQRSLIKGHSAAYFVAQMIPDSCDIHVAKGTNHPALFSDSLFTGPAHWISGSTPEALSKGQSLHCYFRFQHVHPLIKCVVEPLDGAGFYVTLPHAMRAVTPGQWAVFYEGEECLGSAQIVNTGPSLYELNHREPIQNHSDFT